MASEHQYTSNPSSEEINLKELVLNYLRHWPWILVSVFVFALGGYFYAISQVNIYESTAVVMVKDAKKGGVGGMDLDIFSDLGIGGGNSNLHNEIEVFNSRTLFRKVVEELGIQQSAMIKTGVVEKDVLFYDDAPIQLELAADRLMNLNFSVVFEVLLIDASKINIKESYADPLTGELREKVFVYSFGNKVITSLGETRFKKTEHFEELPLGNKLFISVASLDAAVDKIKANISIKAANKDATTIIIKHKGPIVGLNNDIINELIRQHEARAIQDKNEVTESTSEFIKQRMVLIERELAIVEDSSEAFKLKNRLIDVESDAAMFLTQESELEKSITQTNIQFALADFMNEFIQKAKGYDELLPANLGFEDVSISSLTAEHNKLVLERNRLMESSSAKNPMVSNLNGQIESIRSSLEESLNKLKQSLDLQLQVLKEQEAFYKGKLANVPEYEREYREILRQQQIKETLYLYLLQKREENQIAMASTLGSVKVLDYAYTSREPVAPKKKIIFLGALFIGLILPIGVIYVRDLLDTKISNKEELERLGIPFLGQVPLNTSKDYIVAQADNRSAVSEAMRMLRANLSFLVPQNSGAGKVIFSSSTIAGEGKTFTAINLANSLALSNKKVLLLGLDLRAPKISEYLGELNENGVSDYIVNPAITIPQVVRKGKGVVLFDYILSGSVPPNPSELLLSDRLKEVFAFARENYDYIIVDTAPIGLVVDTISILAEADALLYVVRANYLDKKALDIPRKLAKDQEELTMALVLNGVKMKSGVYGNYGYGYGYGSEQKSFWKRMFRK